jgi:hypothetical protein
MKMRKKQRLRALIAKENTYNLFNCLNAFTLSSTLSLMFFQNRLMSPIW